MLTALLIVNFLLTASILLAAILFARLLLRYVNPATYRKNVVTDKLAKTGIGTGKRSKSEPISQVVVDNLLGKVTEDVSKPIADFMNKV